ncbi:hypothetical protein BGZ93_008068 [Podila epicladia]|nr:hypothetical protein BGZ92_007501 [Podila epicladia]KAG0093013.1 hypothetical protein BGZ93_008068 [Podila epicladia]
MARQLALLDPSLAEESSFPSLEATAQAPVTTQESTSFMNENSNESTEDVCSTSAVTGKQQSQTYYHEHLPPPPFPLLLKDILSIKWTAINDISDPPSTDSSSPPNTAKKQVCGAKKNRGQNMNNIYGTYSRGFRAIQPSPDPPHPDSRSLAAPSQLKMNSAKSSSSCPVSSTVTAKTFPGRDLIQEQTTLRRRFRNQVSKAIGNNALLLANTGSISYGEERIGGAKEYTTDPDTLVHPFTQEQLDAKYRDSLQIYLQEHYSSSKAIATILEKSVRHFQWCCAMWDFVPVGNNTLNDPSTPQKEVIRLAKELKHLEKEHRSSLPKTVDTDSKHHSLSRFQTPALSICSSTVASAATSPALSFSIPPTPLPSFWLDCAYTVEHIETLEQCGLGFDVKTDSEVHRDKDKVKDEGQTKDQVPVKDKKPNKGQFKDQAKDTAKAKVVEGKGKTQIKDKENTKGENKKNTKGKIKETTKGKVKEITKENTKDLPRGQEKPKLDTRVLKKDGGDETPTAAKLCAVEKTSDKSKKGCQRDMPMTQDLSTDAPQKSVTQGIEKETSGDSRLQDRPPVLTKASVKNKGRDTRSFEHHPRPPKRPLDDDYSSASISTQVGQANRKRKL